MPTDTANKCADCGADLELINDEAVCPNCDIDEDEI